MGKLMVTEFMSLDGVSEAPGGEPGYRHTGWVTWFPDDGQFTFKADETFAHSALLLGRVTYQSFAEAWPGREGPFAAKMNAMPKYVVSRTLNQLTWNNSTLLAGDIPSAVQKLKAEVPGDILVAGSRTLVNTLRAHDLVDLYRVMIFPVLLGSGQKLFDPASEALPLKLIQTQQFGGAAAALTFERVRGAQ